MVIITGVLALYTYRLFNVAAKSSIDTKEAVKQAQRANDLTERSIRDAERAAIHNDSISNANLDLAKSSLAAQINSVKETQRQFVIQNQPHLQIDWVKLELDTIKESLLKYKISDFGNQPVLVLEENTYATIDFITSRDRVKWQDSLQQGVHKSFIGRDAKATEAIILPALTQAEIERIKNDEGKVFLTGYVKYRNINGDTMWYIFKLRVFFDSTYIVITDNPFSKSLPNNWDKN